MSRAFDSAAGADSITFSVGNAPPDQGPITIAVLAKSASVAGFTMWMARGLKAGTPIWGFLTSNNAGPKLFSENDFGNGVAGLSTSWRWYVMTKASGLAAPRIHVWDLSGTWAHTDDSATVSDGTGPIDTLVVGGTGGGSNGWRGSIAAVATWTSALNDAAVQAACTLNAVDLAAASPGWGVLLNQASTATSVTDFTGGGGDQSAIAGTTVDADEPPGWSYSLTVNPAPAGVAVPVALGQPTTALVSAAPTGLAVPVAVGTPAAALGRSAAPSGIAVPVAMGQPQASLIAAAPNGVAVPVALGTPTIGYTLVAAPTGIAVPVHLGTPSTVAPAQHSAPTNNLVTATRPLVLTTGTPPTS